MLQTNEFSGKVVLVTGASQGLGGNQPAIRAIGLESDHGARHEEKLAQAKARIESNAKVHIRACDLSDRENIRDLFRSVREDLGRIDVLVNNLGAFSEKLEWNAIDHELWMKTLDTNTLSAYFCMVEAADIMVANGISGAIVNIGSSSALQLKRGRLHYSVSKAALHTLSRVAALDLAKHQIRVNVVSPGPTQTEAVDQRMKDPVQREQEEIRLRKIPLGRYASTADIANAVVFLSSSKAQFITGAILPVDGGYTIGETV